MFFFIILDKREQKDLVAKERKQDFDECPSRNARSNNSNVYGIWRDMDHFF